VSTVIFVNRAPVLTLWAAIVAERLGYPWDECLSLGKAVAALTAQNKGEHSGDYEKAAEEGKPAKKQRMGAHQFIELCGRNVPISSTPEKMRALSGGKEVKSEEVEEYIKVSFGEDLPAVLAVMRKLAKAYSRDELQQKAVGLYLGFMPNSNRGNLDISKIEKAMPAV